ncbi:MAG: hypothetical protein MUC63_02755 [Planctomycetes bacterium]|jgi:hypothetical protein|nr:hypothetical protein [Planctomycetota bacterium]
MAMRFRDLDCLFTGCGFFLVGALTLLLFGGGVAYVGSFADMDPAGRRALLLAGGVFAVIALAGLFLAVLHRGGTDLDFDAGEGRIWGKTLLFLRAERRFPLREIRAVILEQDTQLWPREVRHPTWAVVLVFGDGTRVELRTPGWSGTLGFRMDREKARSVGAEIAARLKVPLHEG